MTKETAYITRLANRGAHRARETARKAGVPVAYALGGTVVYQMPDGRIVDKI